MNCLLVIAIYCLCLLYLALHAKQIKFIIIAKSTLTVVMKILNDCGYDAFVRLFTENERC